MAGVLEATSRRPRIIEPDPMKDQERAQAQNPVAALDPKVTQVVLVAAAATNAVPAGAAR